MNQLRRFRRGGAITPSTPGMVAKQMTFNPSITMPPLPTSGGGTTAPGYTGKQIQRQNKDTQEIQSFRYSIPNGQSKQTPILTSSGLFLKGIAISVSAFTLLADTSVTFSINNKSALTSVSCLLLIPNYSQGLLYYPLPQLLSGKDTFALLFDKQDVGTVTAYWSMVFIPAF